MKTDNSSDFDLSLISREFQRFDFHDLSASQEFIIENGVSTDELHNIIISDCTRLLKTVLGSDDICKEHKHLASMAIKQASPKCLRFLLLNGFRIDWDHLDEAYQTGLKNRADMTYIKAIITQQAGYDQKYTLLPHIINLPVILKKI